MTPAGRLQAACQTLGWSARALAERLDCNPRTVQRWWSGEAGTEPPDVVVESIEALARVVATWRVPAWRRR